MPSTRSPGASARLATAPPLAGVTSLLLRQCRLEEPAVAALTGTRALRRLRTIDLYDAMVDGDLLGAFPLAEGGLATADHQQADTESQARKKLSQLHHSKSLLSRFAARQPILLPDLPIFDWQLTLPVIGSQ